MKMPSRYAETVRIPVRFEDGRMRFFYDGPLPDIRDGTLGELVVPRYSVLNGEFHDRLTAKEVTRMVPAGKLILVNVRPTIEVPPRRPQISPDHKEYLQKVMRIFFQYDGVSMRQRRIMYTGGYFVEVRLLEDLKLYLRAAKPSSLCPCRCHIPYMESTVRSLNQAYTRISEAFEPQRASHTGNVFNSCFFISVSENRGFWRPLADLRNALEGKFQARMFDQS